MLDHGGNEVLTWMAANLHILSDKNENRMPSKKHSTARIDGIAALIMAIGRWMADEDTAGWEGFLGRPITA
jgi:phage terminase large subunit-like protein